MSKPQTELATALAAIAGSVTANPALRLDGLAPAALVKPATAAEVADCLRVCSEMKVTVVPSGRGTWLECGNPLRRADVVLSLERMSRIIDYSPPDLVVTLHAAMGCVNWDGPAGAFAALILTSINNYPLCATLGYDTPGSLGLLTGLDKNIPTVTIELRAENASTLVEENLPALLALLKQFAAK